MREVSSSRLRTENCYLRTDFLNRQLFLQTTRHFLLRFSGEIQDKFLYTIRLLVDST